MTKDELLIEILLDIKVILREHTHTPQHFQIHQKEEVMDLNQKIHQLEEKMNWKIKGG